MRQGHYAEAEDAFARAIEENPNSADARYYHAKASLSGAQFDVIDSIGLGYETGFDAILFDTTINNKTYNYRFVNDNLLSGWPDNYYFSVTSYDKGNPANNLPSMESSIYENQTYAVPGKTHEQRNFEAERC